MPYNAAVDKYTLYTRQRAIGLNPSGTNRHAVTAEMINTYQRPNPSTGFTTNRQAPAFQNKTGIFEGEMYGSGDAYALWSYDCDEYYKKYMPKPFSNNLDFIAYAGNTENIVNQSNNNGILYNGNNHGLGQGVFSDEFGYQVRITNNYVSQYFYFEAPATCNIVNNNWRLAVHTSTCNLPTYIRGIIVGRNNLGVYVIGSNSPTSTGTMQMYYAPNWWDGLFGNKFIYVTTINVTSIIGSSNWDTSRILIGTYNNANGYSCQLLVMKSSNYGFNIEFDVDQLSLNNNGHGWLLQGYDPQHLSLRLSTDATNTVITSFGICGCIVQTKDISQSAYYQVLENNGNWLIHTVRPSMYSDNASDDVPFIFVFDDSSNIRNYSTIGLIMMYKTSGTNRYEFAKIVNYFTMGSTSMTDDATILITRNGLIPIQTRQILSVCGPNSHWCGIEAIVDPYLFFDSVDTQERVSNQITNTYFFSERSLNKNIDMYQYGLTRSILKISF